MHDTVGGVGDDSIEGLASPQHCRISGVTSENAHGQRFGFWQAYLSVKPLAKRAAVTSHWMGAAAVLEVFATQPCRDVSSERLDGLGILLDTEAVMPGPPGAFQSGAAPGQRVEDS